MIYAGVNPHLLSRRAGKQDREEECVRYPNVISYSTSRTRQSNVGVCFSPCVSLWEYPISGHFDAYWLAGDTGLEV
jgi:hypothetical protein